MARIGLVAPFPPPLGGMAHQANILAQYLENEGIAVDRVRMNTGRNIPPMRDIATWKQFERVRGLVDAVNIHTCCYLSYFGSAVPVIWRAKRLGMRVVVTYKGGTARQVFDRTGELGLRWLRMADLVTVPSTYLQGVFADFGIETRVVGNLCEEGLPTAEPHMPNVDAPRLIMTRGLGHYYNVECTVRAFQIILRSYPRAMLLLAGGGNREKQIRRYVETLGLPNVTFTGRLDRQGIHELYRSSDIFVNSSAADNFPGALLEASLFGVPIATTNAGGIPHMVEHGVSARMVEIDDHESLAREIIWLLEHPEQSAEMARSAQTLVDRCRWQHARADWLSALLPS